MEQLKKFLLYALLPALIAGAFSIAPKVYDILKEPNAKLDYLITKGPELQGQDGYRRILSLVVTNSGKKPLHKLKAHLSLPVGAFEAVRLQDDSGINPDFKKTGQLNSVRATHLTGIKRSGTSKNSGTYITARFAGSLSKVADLANESDMLHRMFLQPLPQCLVHAGLPPFSGGLERCKDIQIKTNGL